MTGRIGIEIMGIDLERDEPKALKEDGAVTGMSLVVIIVGQVTFEPALHPIYGVPDITFFLTGQSAYCLSGISATSRYFLLRRQLPGRPLWPLPDP